MIVTAWHNGSPRETGSGFGLKVATADRDTYFSRSWSEVAIALPSGEEITVNVAKPSFWGPQCRELISAGIGKWLLAQGLAPWPPSHPPKLQLAPLGDRRFALRP